MKRMEMAESIQLASQPDCHNNVVLSMGRHKVAEAKDSKDTHRGCLSRRVNRPLMLGDLT